MPSEFAIKLVGEPGTHEPLPDDCWLTFYDPDAHAPGQPYPSGAVESSNKVEEALRFPTFSAALAFATQTSKAVPMRPDGEDNKPLTAFDIEIVTVPAKEKTMEPRYPEIEVQLSGEDGNAVAIMERVTRALRRAGVSAEEIEEYRRASTSGDYDHLLQTAMLWVQVS